jgi:hypothetical protein
MFPSFTRPSQRTVPRRPACRKISFIEVEGVDPVLLGVDSHTRTIVVRTRTIRAGEIGR